MLSWFSITLLKSKQMSFFHFIQIFKLLANTEGSLLEDGLLFHKNTTRSSVPWRSCVLKLLKLLHFEASYLFHIIEYTFSSQQNHSEVWKKCLIYLFYSFCISKDFIPSARKDAEMNKLINSFIKTTVLDQMKNMLEKTN